MLAELREIVAARLQTLDGVMALADEQGNIGPRLFTPGDDLSTLVLGPRYPLALTAHALLKAHPQARLGVVARGCQERALIELANWQQLDLDAVEIIGVACSQEQAEICGCALPYPTQIALGERAEGCHSTVLQEFLAARSRQERLAFWQRQFAKCIKCYGCRSVCPLCFCETCALEQEVWVDRGRLPLPFPTFHLIKALHTAGSGKCVLCHACEDVCPADIPLSLLYRLLRQDLTETFGYEAGGERVGRPPTFIASLSGRDGRGD